jgi:hypothetical protein
MESAMRVATSPHDFKLMVAAAGEPSVTNQPSAPPRPSEGPGAVEQIVVQTPPEPAPSPLAEPPAYEPVTAAEPAPYERPSMPGGFDAAPAAGAPSAPPPPSPSAPPPPA